MVAIFPQRDFSSAAPFSIQPDHVHDCAHAPFAEAFVVWRFERDELLDGHRGLAVVAVVVGDELAAAIGTQVLEAKSKRHDRVLHEFDQSRKHFVPRHDEVYYLELGVVVGAIGHEAVVPARRA